MGAKRLIMPTVEEKLRLLNELQTRLRNHPAKTWAQKQKAKQEYEYNQKMIAELEKYQELKVDDWVTNQKEVGQIKELSLSPGGMPQVWVSWNDSVPEIAHRLDLLIVLEENWNHGFSWGDLVLFAQGTSEPQQSGTLIQFAWSEEHSCALPVVKEGETEESRLVLFEDLTLVPQQQKPFVSETELEGNSLQAEKKANLSSSRQIIIDQEFKSLIPVLSPEEKSQLEKNLISEGCRDPLVIWKGYNILLDGHNRYEICVKNGINYELIEIELPNREEAHLWMMRNQLGRRNLQPEALSYFRGKLQAAVKKKIKNPTGKNQYSEVKCKSCTKADSLQNEEENQFSKNIDTGENLAQELKVSRRTIYNDAKYAKAVDQITELVGSEIRPKILAKTTGKKLTKKKTLELAKTAQRKPEEVIEYFNPGTMKKSNPAEIKPFPFAVGEVVRIVPKQEPNLRGKGGYWAIITQVHLTCCNLQLWNGTVELVSAEHLVSLELSRAECEQMKALCDRLSHLRAVADDPIVDHNLQFWGHLPQPKLTPVQEGILEYLEQIYLS
jgi:hypothetical protein